MTEAIEGEIMPSDVGGAPTKYTPAVVNKLVAAFNNAFNITEACEYSGISRETYYNWLETQDGFSDKMTEAQSAPNRKAKEVIITAINSKDVNTARWFLDRRDPDFKAKFEGEITPGERQTTEQKLKEFLDDTKDGAYDDQRGEHSATTVTDSGSEMAHSPTDIS